MKLSVLLLASVATCACAAPFELKEGDRVLLLGDALLERENTYGLLETRMHEQFPNVKFTVRNLSWSGETPKGWSRASFDGPEKGWERLKEQIAEVKPTVAILGFGMAASLQEMTDRSGDQTLNPDPVRYGAEPMSAARFKKELGELMDAINERTPDKKPARFVLLSPIKHEDLRDIRPGMVDPAKHNELLAQYSKATSELAREREARWADVSEVAPAPEILAQLRADFPKVAPNLRFTENGVHLTTGGYLTLAYGVLSPVLEWKMAALKGNAREALSATILKKNDLFFHQFRPANSTYLFGFRKHEQGKNAAEMPKFTPLIEAADAEIDQLKRMSKAELALQFGIPPFDGPWNHRSEVTLPVAKPKAEPPESGPRLELRLSPGKYTLGKFETDNLEALGTELKKQSGSPGTKLAITADKTLKYTEVRKVMQTAGKAGFANVIFTVEEKPAPPLPLPNFTVADGFELTLWADTHLVGKPVGMNWDAQGRLWVACSPVYPQIEPGAHPHDKVVVLEDADRDGKADKTTTFATNLLIAAGVAPDFASARSGGQSSEAVPASSKTNPGGTPDTSKTPATPKTPAVTAAYVGSSTELVRVEDTDGDGKGDQRRIVLSGFGTEDTHHTIHTLRWGPDGRLYFNQSIYIHSHMETPYGMVRLNSGGICAYDPRTERVEVFARGFINTWGHAWDQWGQSFATDGAGFEGVHWIIPGAMYRTYEGARRILPSISPGTYPKYCGLELIQSPLFPEDWQGNAITCDFRAHKITRFQINDLSQPKEPGKEPLSGYVTKELPNPVVTSDASFRPIDVKLGPDGALYIADWTNPIINHGEVDFRDPRRDHTNGRIWRLAPKGKAALKWENLAASGIETVVSMLTDENSWTKEQARQVARRFPTPTVEAALIRRAEEKYASEKSDDGSRPFALESAWLAGDGLAHAKSLVGKHLGPLEDAGFWSAQVLDSRHQAMIARLTSSIVTRANERNYKARQERIRNKPELQSAAAHFDELRAEAAIIESHFLGVWRRQRNTPSDAERSGLSQELNELSIREREIRKALDEIGRKHPDVVFSKRLNHGLSEILHVGSQSPQPRIRLEAMRALARVPTAESAALILEAALNVPGGAAKSTKSEDKGTNQFNQPTFSDTADPHYGYAAWLSINDLDDIFLQALTDGTWKPDNAAKQQQLAWALGALRPEKAGKGLSDFIAKNGLPKDGSGPWIELIGQAGGPKELRILLDGILANTVSNEQGAGPMADKKYAFTGPDANRRAAAALLAAAKRGLKPANPPWGGSEIFIFAPNDALDDLIRAAGYWKYPVAQACMFHLSREIPASRVDAIFESLRTLANDDSAYHLTTFLSPGLAKDPYAEHRVALKVIHPGTRRRALTALAAFRPDVSLTFLRPVLEETDSKAQLALWRELFSSEPFIKAIIAKLPDLTKEQAKPALRAARELGKRGENLVAALTPLAGETAVADVPVNVNALVDMTKKNGNPAEGELIYRRAALTCTVCHAIGGAGGKVGPDLGTIGASAPLDYLIESTVNPAVKVKEGFHAIAASLKDGRTVSGTIAKETDRDLLLRDMTGAEQTVEKSSIKERTNIGSLMPAGLTNTLNDREKANLFAFMAQLGKPGPFDASKSNIARTWRIYPGDQVEQVVSNKADPAKGIAVHSLVDGRVTKELLEVPLAVAGSSPTIVAAARFNTVSAAKSRLHLAGITKAWLDGAPLAIASDPNPVVDLTAGDHTLVIKLDTAAIPAHFRAEVPEARFLTE